MSSPAVVASPSSASAHSYPSPSPSGSFHDSTNTNNHPSPSPSPSPAVYTAEEPRRSKRDSTASSTRRHEEAAAAAASSSSSSAMMNRYPSPPTTSTPNTRSRPQSLVIDEKSLQIPPYNPNRRRGDPSSSSSSHRVPPPPPSTLLDSDRLNTGSLAPSSRIPATHQTSHRPASAAVHPVAPLSAIPIHLNGGVIPPSPLGSGTPYSSSSIPSAGSSSSSASSSRVRQSVGYLPNSGGPLAGTTGAGPYPHLYTPHQMPRQRIYFGPYILLQTLGEGEFGKVKLGIHSERWGEEVAIKLIKRGNVDTAQRGEKVRREIEVLKMVRHPNIVRLYDVIETEKYIGIVLEYASGGELFDHILAHRYLKERDASRLFAQLISGVAYLHAKGIVHRDLKLENLLLDRNRNVVVTDFGFANRFEDATDDLMATSCGSPCYAAPELVVQEGKYVGTAVDVWSCGVILYAMLAGYLPYDDDPANPEGDNINLLYKYIINTPLSFPEWITAAPRNLLLMMLVPNPELRCTLEQVTKHPFLRNYSAAFEKTVDELEKMAQDAEMAKRQALEAQRLFLVKKAQQELLAANGGVPPGSGGGGRGEGGLNPLQAQALARSQSSNQHATSTAAKHRSAIVTSSTVQHSMNEQHHLHHVQQQQQHYLLQQQQQQQLLQSQQRSQSPFPSSVPEEIPPHSGGAQSQPMATRSSTNSSTFRPSRRDSLVTSTSPPTTQSHSISVDADPFSYESRSTPPPSSSSSSNSRPHSSAMMVTSYSASPNLPSGALDQLRSMETDEQQPLYHPSLPTTQRVVQEEFAVPLTPSTRSSRRSVVGGTPSSASVSPAGGMSETDRRKRSNRATVQVEYDGGAESRERKRKDVVAPIVETPSVAPREAEVVPALAPVIIAGGEGLGQVVEAKEEEYKSMAIEEEEKFGKTEVETVAIPQPPLDASTESAPMDTSSSDVPPPQPNDSLSAPQLPSTPTSASGPQRKRKSSGTPTSGNDIFVDPVPVPMPSATSTPARVTLKPSETNSSLRSKKTSDPSPTDIPRPPSSASARTAASGITPSRHRATPSSDRFSIRALLSGSNGSLEKAAPAPAPVASAPPPQKIAPVVFEQPKEQQALDEVTNSRKSRRQKALSLQPFRAGTSSKLTKIRATEVENKAAMAARDGARTRSSTIAGSPPPPPSPSSMQPLPRPSALGSRIIPTRASTTKGASTAQATWNSSQAGGTPSGKAKAVMDWFRRKSIRGFPAADVGMTSADGTPALPIRTDFDHARRRPSSTFAEPPSSPTTLESGPPSSILAASPPSQNTSGAPSVIVTQPGIAKPGGTTELTPRSASGAMSVSTVADQSPPSSSPSMTPASASIPVFTDAKLRVHQGALDKSAITSRSPPVVMQEIKVALYNMGIEVMMEPGSEFKLKCVRRSRKKALAGNGGGAISTGSVHSTHSNQSGPAAPASSSTLDRRTGLPASSSSMTLNNASTLNASPASGFRSFFNRRASVIPRSPSLAVEMPASPAMTMSPSSDAFDTPMTRVVSHFSGQPQPLPLYGESDAGDEVKFYVELTKVRALEGLYCIDLKRMKGGPWSFKFVYDQLISALDLKSA